VNFLVAFFNTAFTYPIFNGLMALYFLLGDFGLAIVVLTCIISLLLLPLTLRQLRFAKTMRKLQPQITAIRQQYATDRQVQTQVLHALYQEGVVQGFVQKWAIFKPRHIGLSLID
jgi:membrane protein insertase Oxa1/YidC/SpoIIIJ